MSRDADELPEKTVTAWARLVRVSQALLTRVETDLKAEGFPPLAWYDALLELRRAGAGGLRPYQLQERMLLAQYNLSRLIDRLVKAGHVRRGDCVEDGRGQILHITESGLDLLQRMWPAYRQAIAAHFAAKLTDRQVDALSEALERLKDPS